MSEGHRRGEGEERVGSPAAVGWIHGGGEGGKGMRGLGRGEHHARGERKASKTAATAGRGRRRWRVKVGRWQGGGADN